MNLVKNTATNLKRLITIASLVTFSSASMANEFPTVVDDFNNKQTNNLGAARQFIDDKMVGGKTNTNIAIAHGKMHITGDIVPPRGQPGWASAVLLLNPQGTPQNISEYKGVRLLMKVAKGSFSVSANSADVTNFDYHASPITIASDGKFHEVNIPFDSMKRAWSEQTTLNTETITGLSIVAFGIQKTSFDFEIDEVTFY